MSKKNTREWHPAFKKYTEFIVAHDNYKGLYFQRNADKNINWVVTGSSKNGLKRRIWWDKQCEKHNIKIEAGCYAKIALKIHPTKLHTCQICGKELSLYYVYLNKRGLTKFEDYFNTTIEPFSINIFDIIDELVKNPTDIAKIATFFKIDAQFTFSKKSLKQYIKKEFVNTSTKGLLSPGVMSNSPDRFDGFHSDGACCRHESDKGRHKTNLTKYGEDRRAYENWSGGDWKAASWLMKQFNLAGISPDHIGPLSLGFAHRPRFQAMTSAENSAKNNRMTFDDVQLLINDEKEGETVVSSHSRFIWDKLKLHIKNDADALALSKLMRENMHNILIIFYKIYKQGYETFLIQSFLHPEYAFFKIDFIGFNAKDGSYKEIVKTRGTKKQYSNNANRYIKKSLEALDSYQAIDNRNVSEINSDAIEQQLQKLINSLATNQFKKARTDIDTIFKMLANTSYKKFMKK